MQRSNAELQYSKLESIIALVFWSSAFLMRCDMQPYHGFRKVANCVSLRALTFYGEKKATTWGAEFCQTPGKQILDRHWPFRQNSKGGNTGPEKSFRRWIPNLCGLVCTHSVKIMNDPIDNKNGIQTYLDYSCLFPKNSKLVECTKVNTNTHGYARVTPTSVKI